MAIPVQANTIAMRLPLRFTGKYDIIQYDNEKCIESVALFSSMGSGSIEVRADAMLVAELPRM